MNTLIKQLSIVIAVILFSFSSMATANQSWKFKVYYDEKEIGEHTFRLKTLNENTHVEIKADFDVKVLFINAYSYTHTNYEVWNGNCLKSIRSVTDDNGTKLQVYGESQGQLLKVNTMAGQHKAEGCIKTFAYWDPSFLESQALLNAQTGQLMPVTVEYLGKETISVRDNPTEAKRYRLNTEDFTIDLWYSNDNEWVALNSTTRDGNVLRYQIQ